MSSTQSANSISQDKSTVSIPAGGASTNCGCEDFVMVPKSFLSTSVSRELSNGHSRESSQLLLTSQVSGLPNLGNGMVAEKKIQDQKCNDSLTMAPLAAKQSQLVGKMSLPPPRELNPVYRRTLRFQALADVTNVPVTDSGMLATLGGMRGSGASSLQLFCSAYKLNTIRIWPSTNSLTTECYLTWSLNSGGVPDTDRDQTLPKGLAVTSLNSFKPPKQALASFWRNYGSSTLFFVTCPSGSIVEIDVDFNIASSISVVNVTTANTLGYGIAYYAYLDVFSGSPQLISFLGTPIY